MSRIEEIQKQIEELEKKTQELQKELELEKQKTEIEYPFKENEKYFSIDIDGELLQGSWLNKCDYNQSCYDLGNVFHTRKEAEIEIERRILLTRFRQFRDKCNGDWKPFEHGNQFYISFDTMTNVIHTNCVYINKSFALFGYFKKKTDCERAIELFGKEIKRLWVDE